MNLDWVRQQCMSFPGATENVQWGNDLVFKVGGKMFAVACLEAAEYRLSFKATDEEFAELTEHDGIDPAPYMARAKWVALETFDKLPRAELERLLRGSYEMVLAKLTRKEREKAMPAKRQKKPKAKPRT
jgi:predicted DNA-binding protein (MmcQ/YjbR family)